MMEKKHGLEKAGALEIAKRPVVAAGQASFAGRYRRNLGVVSEEEQRMLKEKSVCVIGCGGLGGGIIEDLARMGIGKLTIVDGDVFEESNLNRQVLSNEGNLGRPKAEEGAAQMKQINREVEIHPLACRLDEENCRSIIAGHDVVVDALDNVESRLVLEEACEEAGIPLVHGAIAGWNGQAAVVMPGAGLLHRIYSCPEDTQEPEAAGKTQEPEAAGKTQEPETAGETQEPEAAGKTRNPEDAGKPQNPEAAGEGGNPSFTPAVVSGIQAGEVLKLLLNRDGALKNRLLMLDLLYHEYEIIDFGG